MPSGTTISIHLHIRSDVVLEEDPMPVLSLREECEGLLREIAKMQISYFSS